VADIGAGMFATTGILLALQMRNATGRGQRVDTSLLEGQIAMLSYHYTAYFASGKPPQRKGSSAQGLVPYQAFEASDGWMVVAVFTDRMWRDLCAAIGKPEWGDDPRFNSPQQRMVNRDIIISALTGLFATRTVAEWRGKLAPLGIPCTPVLGIDQAATEEQVRAREMIVEVESARCGTLRMAGVPVKFSDATGGVRTAPPALGEHSREILGTLGYGDADFRRLADSGVVAES
jgi:crotonobetainyl-CoA:carnitine CoA-transferase CaiB-like acyl-CoA transferase